MSLSLRQVELNRSWRCGPKDRADARLRTFGRREGDAVFCRVCDGDGLVLYAGDRPRAEPFRKCTHCGGEGLEPPE